MADRAATRRGPLGGVLALLLGLSACDLEVTNPGPVQDEFLDDPAAIPSILLGAKRNIAFAYTRLAEDGAYVAGEAHWGGSGSAADFSLGRLTSDNSSGHWNNMQRGRWVAEDGVRRLREMLGDAFAATPEARDLLLHAGIANKVMGDYVCQAVIDGGAAQPHTVHYERAEAAFTEALDLARSAGDAEMERSALAGRAEVRAAVGDWAGAVADAELVPHDHEVLLHLFDFERQDTDANAVFWAQARLPWSRMTVWNTGIDDYFVDTGDPRVEWTTDPEFPLTMTRGMPFYISTKHDEFRSPHAFATGRGMRLIEAEAALREGDWPTAMTIINALRSSVTSLTTGVALEPWPASSLEEAWTALRRERAIEFWLDGHRFPDFRRWTEEGVPGEGFAPTPDWFPMEQRDLCYPIGRTEIDTNPNDLPVTN